MDPGVYTRQDARGDARTRKARCKAQVTGARGAEAQYERGSGLEFKEEVMFTAAVKSCACLPVRVPFYFLCPAPPLSSIKFSFISSERSNHALICLTSLTLGLVLGSRPRMALQPVIKQLVRVWHGIHALEYVTSADYSEAVIAKW